MYINCPICLRKNVYTIADEYHILMVCPEYENIRIQYFAPIMLSHISLNKLYIAQIVNVQLSL